MNSVLSFVLFALAACSANSSAEREEPVAQGGHEQVSAAYYQVLMEEFCARLHDGDSPRLAMEIDRMRAAVGAAEDAGLGATLRETERKWTYFQSVADWVCGEGAGVTRFAHAITRFDQSVRRRGGG